MMHRAFPTREALEKTKADLDAYQRLLSGSTAADDEDEEEDGSENTRPPSKDMSATVCICVLLCAGRRI